MKKACKDCPWRVNSAKGWLGGQEPELFTGLVEMGEKLPCHATMKGDLSLEDLKTDTKTRHCYGALTTMKNSCKLSSNPKIAEQVKKVERDSSFFSFFSQFLAHHRGK